jgi:DNA (cytosine-5)-methyltransferase 1
MIADVIDLFCGVGGLSLGFRDEGFRVLAGYDIDSTCRHAYETNIGAKFIQNDVANVSADELIPLFSKERRSVLVGCAPCQPFSLYTGRYRQNETEADVGRRWEMLDEFSRLIEAASPDVVSMENVLRVTKHSAFQSFVNRLVGAGYHVTHQRVRAQDYGVPQKRTRLVLFASKLGELRLVNPTHASAPVTVRQAIGDLPAIAAGTSHPEDRLHMSRGLSDRNMMRLRSTKEGGSWKDWTDELRLACHKKEGGKSFRAVYGRMSWDEPSPVITTQCLGIGNGRFGHPQQDRAISLREASLLQSFPRSFDFAPATQNISGLQLARQIGNAVPPLLGRAVARSIRHHLETV